MPTVSDAIEISQLLEIEFKEDGMQAKFDYFTGQMKSEEVSSDLF